MDIENIVLSANYLDFINKLDDLLNEILYSSDGYMSLFSKDAVDNYTNYLNKFDHETVKICKNVDFENTNDVIEEKKHLLKNVMAKHFTRQALEWACDVYQKLIDNCILLVSLNKTNKDYTDKIYARALSAIAWISDVRGLSDFERECLLEKFSFDFNEALKSEDADFLTKKSLLESDKELFIKLRNMVLEDENEFLSLNILNYKDKLVKKDISVLNRYKASLVTFKRTSVQDEIKLVNSAIEILKLNNPNEIYDFILRIEDDFNFFYATNKKLDEQDKITITKRRMHLFKNASKNNYNYYKNLITSSTV